MTDSKREPNLEKEWVQEQLRNGLHVRKKLRHGLYLGRPHDNYDCAVCERLERMLTLPGPAAAYDNIAGHPALVGRYWGPGRVGHVTVTYNCGNCEAGHEAAREADACYATSDAVAQLIATDPRIEDAAAKAIAEAIEARNSDACPTCGRNEA